MLPSSFPKYSIAPLPRGTTPHDLVLTPKGARFLGRYLPCTIGRGGMTATKHEGDGATPRGTHHIVGLLYRRDRLTPPAPWARPIGPGDLWCDAPDHPAYNHQVRAPFTARHERLRRADPQYDIVLITDWNWPNATPYGGSAIFLHQWRRPGAPTAGCLAFRRDHLIWLAERVQPGTRMILR